MRLAQRCSAENSFHTAAVTRYPFHIEAVHLLPRSFELDVPSSSQGPPTERRLSSSQSLFEYLKPAALLLRQAFSFSDQAARSCKSNFVQSI